MSIRIEGVNKHFAAFHALQDINLDIADGELVGLLGPSGSGKTTLLRIIAGLEQQDNGRVLFADQDVSAVHVRDRRVGFVFQHYALFRHMSVFENIAFGLRALPRSQRPDEASIRAKVMNLLDMVQLATMAERLPAQLSGGQRQRVALARALAMSPRVLLLDEPFGALDARVRKELRRWLRELHDELHFTSVFVTHDQEEALEVSDRVVVMSQGHIEQVGAPHEVYARPRSRFVFDFLGHSNSLNGVIRDGRLSSGDAWLQVPGLADGEGQVYLRSHELELCSTGNSDAHLPLKVLSVSPVGAEVRLELQPLGFTADPWEVGISHADWEAQDLQRGQTVQVRPRVGHLFVAGETEPRTLRWA
ncbi:TOBE-like domain-containing protein [Pokkaliibacter sp. MBI-7]|uniref:sulfate/molybdate ABC transporter ATP-binding protein n=1 Tax=Pokkaliibacter sp. MBI-7 TaxID=3040600 RepID=UPI00244C08AA|nr:TOBE-like domain-containing protein [Pokkaliibacter sp. MBI-7]MDH2432562.1 TOBE-like domain-containing protein [Pokkaliibacter sp. MBI-7]